MTDQQFHELRQMMLDLALRVEKIEMHLKRQDADLAARMDPIRDLMAAIVAVEDDDDLFPRTQN